MFFHTDDTRRPRRSATFWLPSWCETSLRSYSSLSSSFLPLLLVNVPPSDAWVSWELSRRPGWGTSGSHWALGVSWSSLVISGSFWGGGLEISVGILPWAPPEVWAVWGASWTFLWFLGPSRGPLPLGCEAISLQTFPVSVSAPLHRSRALGGAAGSAKKSERESK